MPNRIAYYTNESFYEDSPTGMVYMVAEVHENVSGYFPRPEMAAAQLQTALDRCSIVNQQNGLSKQDVLNIVASSMSKQKEIEEAKPASRRR